MPPPPSYPGVYVEEVPSGERTISAVATSISAFVGRALRGPVNEPVPLADFADFERIFGGLWSQSPMSFAVQQYFQNGGAHALVVRVHNGSTTATVDLPCEGRSADKLTIVAANPGAWGAHLTATVTHGSPPLPAPRFNLIIEDNATSAKEVFSDLSTDSASPGFVQRVLEQHSMLARSGETVPTARPAESSSMGFTTGADPDGGAVTKHEMLTGAALADSKCGIYALEKADLFNILCIPPYSPTDDIDAADLPNALSYCRSRRAILLIDPPAATDTVAEAAAFMAALPKDENGALFFPRLLAPNVAAKNRIEAFAPCGAVAGVIARTDASRGVWKPPAGLNAQLIGVAGTSVALSDGENDLLNPLGINCIRDLPVHGPVVWGSRTLKGADHMATEWKYLSVRRTALFLEESLYRGMQWVVLEPNDEPLWAQIRLSVGAFMQNLFLQGAFQASSPREAYFVKCDSETMTQADINQGVVNVLVGFAPLKPAEFVVLQIRQIAGEKTA